MRGAVGIILLVIIRMIITIMIMIITIEIIILPMYCIQAKLRHDMYWFQLILRNILYDYFASQHKLKLAETWIIKCIQFTT